MHRVEPRGGERLEVLGAVAVLREREVRAPVLGAHRRVVDREVAHVQLVDRRVDVLGQRGRLGGAPGRRLVCRVLQVHGDRPGRVQGQRDGVGVRHRGRLDLAGRRHVDGHLVEVARVAHAGRAGPGPVRGPRQVGPGRGAGRRIGRRTGCPREQVDLLRRRRPDPVGRRAPAEGDAVGALAGVGGIQVVEDVGDLHPGGVEHPVEGVEDSHRDLALEDLGHLLRGLAVQAQGEVAGELGMGGDHRGGQPARVPGQRGGRATHDVLRVDAEATGGRPGQPPAQQGRVGSLGHHVSGPRDQVLADPDGPLLGQVGSSAGLDRLGGRDVGAEHVGDRHDHAVGRDGDRDVAAAGRTAGSVVLVPRESVGHLEVVGRRPGAGHWTRCRCRRRRGPGATAACSPGSSRPGSPARTGRTRAR